MRLKSYGFSKNIIATVSPIINAIEQKHFRDAELKLSKLCIDVCDRVEKGTLSPKEGDDYFTLIDLYITDYCANIELRDEIKDIIFEGMLLHDYGKEYGANLDKMKFLASKFKE